MRDPEGSIEREFAGFVTARQHRLLRAAYLVYGDERRAAESLCRALASLAARWERARTGNPDADLRRILYRDAVPRWRPALRQPAGEEPDDEEPGDDEQAGAVGQDVGHRLRRALRGLTARQRAVVVLRFFEDLTELETADLLGVSVGTVRSQTSGALNQLSEIAAELADERRAAGRLERPGHPGERG